MQDKFHKTLHWTLPILLAFLAVSACQAQLVIDSLTGEVTQHEVDTFITNVSAMTIPTSQWTSTITHNQLADGRGGMVLEGINYMAEITADIPSLSTEHTQLLNLAIAWNDAWLTHRNDLPLGEGRVMWTGKVEPVWPPNCPTCSSSTYYESETGDTIGHMAHTAYNVLKTPSIWNNTVPDGDPNNFGATYLARVRTYVSMLELSMSNSFTPYFIDPTTLLITRPSTSQGYQSGFHNVNAWNVQMMLLNAYWELAQCHIILGDNPGLAAEYKTIVQKSTDMFAQNAQPLTAPDGTAVYDWGYCNFGDCTGRLTGEQLGVHGSYDIWGLTRAYATGYTTVPTAQQMKTYADTVVHETTLSIDSAGAATYASFNDRCCSSSTYNYLPYGFIFLTPYNKDIYSPAATADINSGRLAGDPGLTAGVLWAKHWIFIHSAPEFSISLSPVSQTATAGGGASYTASVTPSNGFNGTVDLSVSGMPSGASANFNSASISGGSGSSTLSVSTSASTPAGTFILTITGTSSSPSLTRSTTATLVVNAPPPPDFTIEATPSSQTITQGGSTSYIANVTPSNEFVDTVNLSVTGLPSGATGTFNPTSISGGSGSSTLNVSTAASTQTGTSTLTIIGTSPSLTHSATLTLTVNPATGLPSGWTDTNIGTPGVAGSASFASGTFTVNGGGADIWSSSDNFNYVHESLTGDVTITARVASQQNTNAWAKSGVMIRETTAANAAYVFVFVTPGHGVNMQYRASGTSSVQLAQQTGPVAPYWVRVVRSGSAFNGFSSTDGLTWTQVGTINLIMTGNALEGLAVTAHDNTVVNTSTFDNVSVSAPTGPRALYQINSGGAAATPFAADAFFSAGQTASTTATIDTSAVTTPAPIAVYQAERWGGDVNSNPAPFSYTFANLTPGGSYTVRLHFAEIFWTTTRQRVFNVAINGTPVLTNFDIIAASGAANKAIVQEFTTTADSSGQIVVLYTVGAADAPKSSGIEIITN
jgi:hypothetical protein